MQIREIRRETFVLIRVNSWTENIRAIREIRGEKPFVSIRVNSWTKRYVPIPEIRGENPFVSIRVYSWTEMSSDIFLTRFCSSSILCISASKFKDSP